MLWSHIHAAQLPGRSEGSDAAAALSSAAVDAGFDSSCLIEDSVDSKFFGSGNLA